MYFSFQSCADTQCHILFPPRPVPPGALGNTRGTYHWVLKDLPQVAVVVGGVVVGGGDEPAELVLVGQEHEHSLQRRRRRDQSASGGWGGATITHTHTHKQHPDKHSTLDSGTKYLFATEEEENHEKRKTQNVSLFLEES